jgi:hypothetical protein
VSASAPGSSKKAILSDSEDQWTGPSLPAFVHLKFANAPIHGAEEIAITFQGIDYRNMQDLHADIDRRLCRHENGSMGSGLW